MAEVHPENAADPGNDVVSSQPLNSVSTRIIFFVFLSTFLTALVVSWISIDAIHRHLRGQLEARFPAMLERRVEELDGYLDTARNELATALEALPKSALTTRSKRRLEQSLTDLLLMSPAFAGLALVDDELIARAGELSPELGRALVAPAAAQSGGDGPFAFSMAGPEPAAALALAVPGSGRRLVGVYRLDPLREQLALERDEGPGHVVLADADGRWLLWNAKSLPTVASPTLPLERMLEDGLGEVSEYTGADGEHMLGSARPLDSIPWYLVVEAPFGAVFAPVLSVVKRIFLSDLAIILLFSLVAYRITMAIMQPIEALSEGAARISKGDIEHEIPTPKTRDEIGLLTRTFNDMMHKLRQSQQEIEQDKLRLTEQNEELSRANEVLAQLSITDGLTKLHNHRFFQDHLTREIKRVSRTGEALSMLLMDLDDFKGLNDRHGHAAGDEVLMNIAGLMNDSVRETDLLARYGGEEFVILATNTDLAGAVALAEKIRMSVETSSQIIDDSMRPIRVTISCGVAQYRGDRKRFFQAADRALYSAKAQGKNCVVAAEDDAA